MLVQWRAEIASGQVRVMFLDECHLLWGDLRGYGWSRRNQRVDLPIASTRERQTYYGALDYLSKSFVIHEYETGNQHNTVAFLEYLQAQYDESTRFFIIWDGASYHRSKVIRNHLSQQNHGTQEHHWELTCIQFASNAPEQNPVEDVWLQAKRFSRKFARLCHSFGSVKLPFHLATHLQTFIFEKAFMYGYCSCPV